MTDEYLTRLLERCESTFRMYAGGINDPTMARAMADEVRQAAKALRDAPEPEGSLWTERKPILNLDFDATIHSYDQGWQGATVVGDGPVPGAIAFLKEAVKHFNVAVHSSRSKDDGGREAMQEAMVRWFAEAGEEVHAVYRPLGIVLGCYDDEDRIGVIAFPVNKPAAFLTIDDRALTFTGTWPTMEALLAFKPWNKRTDDVRGTAEKVMAELNKLDDARKLWEELHSEWKEDGLYSREAMNAWSWDTWHQIGALVGADPK